MYLTSEEKIQLWEWAAEYAAPEKLLLAGTGVEGVRFYTHLKTTTMRWPTGIRTGAEFTFPTHHR